jgi:ribonuclease Y
MNIIILIIALVVGIVAGYFIRIYIFEGGIKASKEKANKIIEEAREKAEREKKEILLQAKDEALRIKQESEAEYRERQSRLQKLEKRVTFKEEELDRKNEQLEKRQRNISLRESELNRLRDTLTRQIEEQRLELQRIANLTKDQAKEILLNKVEAEVQHEIASRIKNLEEQFKLEADRKAREIITTAIQRVAAEQTQEATISVVPLPNDDIKGKIIGREGRNIRIFESLTGVDLLVDDTPEVVTISSYDPIRREIGKIALEKLILDGRIHPGRIEELVEQATHEIEQAIITEGENTSIELGIPNLHPEIIKLLGKLKYRTSYSQNVLTHSKEVAAIAGIIASELGEDPNKAKRAGLLHDIGKAIDKEIEGSHAKLGAEILAKYGEPVEVVNAAESHHGDIPATSVISAIVQAADAISASRPGARKEELEAYLKRIESLEKICNEFKGVEKAFAVQAGREARIIVKSTEVDDAMLAKLSYDIVNRIESEMEYPGQIKVVVIRETRAVAYAK